nr:MAG TPA: hypothetical protein [Caudoviricetes sp.]
MKTGCGFRRRNNRFSSDGGCRSCGPVSPVFCPFAVDKAGIAGKSTVRGP